MILGCDAQKRSSWIALVLNEQSWRKCRLSLFCPQRYFSCVLLELLWAHYTVAYTPEEFFLDNCGIVLLIICKEIWKNTDGPQHWSDLVEVCVLTAKCEDHQLAMKSHFSWRPKPKVHLLISFRITLILKGNSCVYQKEWNRDPAVNMNLNLVSRKDSTERNKAVKKQGTNQDWNILMLTHLPVLQHCSGYI